MTGRALAAINLVRTPKRRKSQDGLKRLKSLAKLRATALISRKINFAFLLGSFVLMLIGESASSALAVACFALAALLFERQAEGPPQRRARRIVSDQRPILLKSMLVVPPQRREGRILSLPATPIILALPPSRPRARIVQRREVTVGDDSD